MARSTDLPGVIAPPPLVVLFFLLSGLLLDVHLGVQHGLPVVGWMERLFAGAVLLLVSIILFAASANGFRRAGTPVPTSAPTSALVTTGVHGLSRNPIYLGFVVFHLGLAVLLNSWGLLATLVPSVLLLRFGVIAREEAYLLQKFGSAYEEYRARVPRWL